MAGRDDDEKYLNTSREDARPTGIVEKGVALEVPNAELEKLERSCSYGVLYILGKDQMSIKEGTNYARKTLLWLFLWLRENKRNKMATLRVPVDRVTEAGFLKDI